MGEELSVSERFENKEEKLVPPTRIERATRGLGNLTEENSPDEETPPKSKDFLDTWLD